MPYLSKLGISHLYLSPILQARDNSKHGYDVVNHSKVSEQLGGLDGFKDLANFAHENNMGIIVDIVPNHMALPDRAWENHQLWDVLKKGSKSCYSHWFDINWKSDEGGGKVILPILSKRISECIDQGDFTVSQMEIPQSMGSFNKQPITEWVIKYQTHIFPIKKGTQNLSLTELLEQQNYRLTYWESGEDELNYRRFFDIQTLFALRIDDLDVFTQTHKLICELVSGGYIDCLRVDHPDGLANPKKYFDWLYDATDGVWVVAEKILQTDESLPEDWKICGSTGYKALNIIHHSMLNPYGFFDLLNISSRANYEARNLRNILPPVDPLYIDDAYINNTERVCAAAKEQIIRSELYPDLARLADSLVKICHHEISLRDHSRRALRACVQHILVFFPVYRPYIEIDQQISKPSRDAINYAVDAALRVVDDDMIDTINMIKSLLLHEVTIHNLDAYSEYVKFLNMFSQVSAALMAKGIEDTAYYRSSTLLSIYEVGGDLGAFSRSMHTFHNYALTVQNLAPYTLTAGTTHDTKRSEDIRSSISTLSENSYIWKELLQKVREEASIYRTPFIDPVVENSLWQTIAGTWYPSSDGGRPINVERLQEYILKHMREAKTYTSWRKRNLQYESAMLKYCEDILQNDKIISLFKEWMKTQYSFIRSAILSFKAIQLTIPGVCDLFQGSEIIIQKLVDPDNRSAVDFHALDDTLQKIYNPNFDITKIPGDYDNLRINTDYVPQNIDEEKMIITVAALGLRYDYEDAFCGADANYQPLSSSSDCAFGFIRHDKECPRAITVVSRIPGSRMRHGNYAQHYISLPKPPNDSQLWCNILTGKLYEDGNVMLTDIFEQYPVAFFQPVRKRDVINTNYLSAWAPNASKIDCYILKNDKNISEIDFNQDMTPNNHNLEWEIIPMSRVHPSDNTVSFTAFDGVWKTTRPILDGANYYFKVDDSKLLPDPVSPRQCFGVHGPSNNINFNNYRFDDDLWNGIQFRGKVFYEIHIGTFTPEGTFAAAIEKLPELLSLGVDIIEVMPISVFDGKRGWGYDGVDIYAVNEEYGGVTEFQNFVNAAHNLGLAVCLDVVYNHLGPEGNYLNDFGPYYTDKHITPWGKGFNFDDKHSDYVREWIINHALRSFDKLGVDCLRLDATHEIHDDSDNHILAELSEKTYAYAYDTGKNVALIAEGKDHTGAFMTKRRDGGYGLDMLWGDEFHHALWTYLSGERNGYYIDYGGIELVAKALKYGNVYDGQYSEYHKCNYGVPMANDFDLRRLIVFVSNHDQVGNRAFGDRPNFILEDAKLLQISALTILSPFSPLIFQGEDWAASTPFQFFVNFSNDEINDLCREGRKKEFESFGWQEIYDNEEIPDPASVQTFENSKLKWDEIGLEEHGTMHDWYQQLLSIRKKFIGHAPIISDEVEVKTLKNDTGDIVFYRHSGLCIVCNFSDSNAQVGVSVSNKRPHIILSNAKNRINLSGILQIRPHSVCVIEYR